MTRRAKMSALVGLAYTSRSSVLIRFEGLPLDFSPCKLEPGFLYPPIAHATGRVAPVERRNGFCDLRITKPEQAGEPPATSSRAWLFDWSFVCSSVGRAGRTVVVSSSLTAQMTIQTIRPAKITIVASVGLGDAQQEALEKLRARLQIRAKGHDRDGSLAGLLPAKDHPSSTCCGKCAGCNALDVALGRSHKKASASRSRDTCLSG